MSGRNLKRVLSCAVASSALIAAVGSFAPAMAQIEEIIVTSQRVEQSIQSIPISVTAFDSGAMERQQIEDFSDLQFNTPNVNFSRGNFGGGNFQIRGIGSASVSSSGDGGVGMHMNEVPLRSGHLFDMEYYDVERVEVMRGPQGTLYGRNSTGGAVNVISQKPQIGEWMMNVGATAANFNSTRMTGMANVPLGENIAIRIAGSKLDRDGYTQNLYTGNAIDGRDQLSWRASAAWDLGDRTSVNFMYQFFEEDSSRTRANKPLCHRDATAIYGCLPDKRAFDTVNANATWPNLFASSLIVGPALAIQGGPYDPASDAFGASINPSDMRQVALDFDPTYEAEDKFYTYGFSHEFDRGTLHYAGSHMESMDISRSDFNNAVSETMSPNPIAMFVFPTSSSFLFPNGQWPTSVITSSGTGSVGGHLTFSDASHSFDQSNDISEQTTHELRYQSSLDGDVNFLLGAFYMETDNPVNNYFVNSSAFDYLAMLLGPIWLSGALEAAELATPGTLAALGTNAAAVADITNFDGVGMVGPMFNSETKDNTLESWALFGEAYFNVGDNLKLTGGLRYTTDEKAISTRSTGFDAAGISGDCMTCVQPYDQSVIDNLVPGTALYAAYAAGLIAPFDTPNAMSYTNQSEKWNATTGRLAFDWTPDLERTDSTLVYGSISRGYKGGGFNPAGNSNPNINRTYDPEYITAYELGMKSDFSEKFRWNLVGFFYDYEGLQISKIIDRSSVNGNVDATIHGLESEMFLAPNENWLFNLNLSYLKTEIDDYQDFDPGNVTAGLSTSTIIKDPTSGANCVINENGGTPLDTVIGAGGWTVLNEIASNQSTFGGYPFDPVNNPNFMLCNGLLMDPVLAGINAAIPGAAYTWGPGVEQDLSGNSLANSPEYSMTFGAQHTKYFKSGATLVSRLDYFKQAEMWTRIFNEPATDKIDSWSQLNASVAYSPEEGDWQIKAFVQNIMDDDNITNLYLSSQASGLFTNAFILEPRVYGVTVDFRF